MAAFSDSTAQGMWMSDEASSRACEERPAPSLPIISAQGATRYASIAGVALVERATAAKRRMSASFKLAVMLESESRRMGMRKTEPAEARTAFAFHGLTQSGVSHTCAMPKASADRRRVPRLPGSCSDSTTRWMAGWAIACAMMRGIASVAAMPCGAAVSTALAKTSRLSTDCRVGSESCERRPI